MLTPFSQPLKSEPAATGDHWVQIWTGNSAEPFGQREREPASIGQVERLIGADVDAGRIHRLAVVERPAQIEAAIAALRQFS